MALQKSYSDAFGHVDAQAYHRVMGYEKVSPVNATELFRFSIGIFKDSDARLGQAAPMTVCYAEVSGTDFDAYFSPSALSAAGNCPKKQIYLYLKSRVPCDALPDYRTGTTDV